jgi:hypothetical protein
MLCLFCLGYFMKGDHVAVERRIGVDVRLPRR